MTSDSLTGCVFGEIHTYIHTYIYRYIYVYKLTMYTNAGRGLSMRPDHFNLTTRASYI